MELDNLLEKLEMDSPEDFNYFEHFSDLVESSYHIEYENFYAVLSTVSEDTITELCENYFTEIIDNLPDNVIDIYTLLSTIQKTLVGLANTVDNDDGRRAFIDELYKFRAWYSIDSIVHCTKKKNGQISDMVISEALATARLEKFGEDSFDYDFSNCMDYEIEEYSINITTMTDDNEISSHEKNSTYEQGLIDEDNPVIDGDFDYENDDL